MSQEELKVCSHCGEEKPRDLKHFYSNPGTPDKLDHRCKVCQNAYKSELRRGKTKAKRYVGIEYLPGGVARVPVTNKPGTYTLVDVEDLPLISLRKWGTNNKGYLCAMIDRRTIMFHRLIAGTPEGLLTDHINGDKLDNRRCNLRICTGTENVRNQAGRKNKASLYKGVSRRNDRYRARIAANGMEHYLGWFGSAVEAALAYDRAAQRLHGEFARLNFPGYNPDRNSQAA